MLRVLIKSRFQSFLYSLFKGKRGSKRKSLNGTSVAKGLGIKVIGLTGAKGGKLADVADVAIKVPETETYMIQELHLPIYHCLCLMLEEHFFGLSK